MAQRQITHLTPRALAIMDWMLAHPGSPQVECARELGLTATWVSIVARSDVFQAEYQRRQRLLREQIDTKLAGTAIKALDRLEAELERTTNPAFILSAVDILSARFVQMQRGTPAVVQNVQQNMFVASADDIRQAKETARRIRD